MTLYHVHNHTLYRQLYNPIIDSCIKRNSRRIPQIQERLRFYFEVNINLYNKG